LVANGKRAQGWQFNMSRIAVSTGSRSARYRPGVAPLTAHRFYPVHRCPSGLGEPSATAAPKFAIIHDLYASSLDVVEFVCNVARDGVLLSAKLLLVNTAIAAAPQGQDFSRDLRFTDRMR